jgi:hypothetical protein
MDQPDTGKGEVMEDRYGYLQHFYFRSENGDLMVNHDFRRVGVVKKTRRFMRILENTTEVDLYEWVYPKEQETKVAIYRAKDEGVNVLSIRYNQLQHLIDADQVELVVKN